MAEMHEITGPSDEESDHDMEQVSNQRPMPMPLSLSIAS
jgi:hypothetical protein